MIELAYRPPLSKVLSRRMLRYIVCGVMNYIVFNALLYHLIYNYIIAKENLEILRFVISPHIATLIVVFPITFLAGFWLNRYVAFRASESRIRGQMLRYILSLLGSIVLSYMILKVLVEHFGVWPTPANVLCSLITSTYSYLMARFVTFVGGKERGQEE